MSHLVPMHSQQQVQQLRSYAREKFNHRPLYSYADCLAFTNLVLDQLDKTAEHQIIAATISGSVLRGTNTKSSDLDIIAVAADKNLRKPKNYQLGGIAVRSQIMAVEVSVVPLSVFTDRLGVSIPYTEALHSPYLLVDPRYKAYFSALTPSYLELEFHATNFVGHALHRDNLPPAKALKTAASVYHLLYESNMVPLIPRNYTDDKNQDIPEHVVAWAESQKQAYVDNKNKQHHH